MNDKKQIEEMAQHIKNTSLPLSAVESELLADVLYMLGYRKQSENVIELPCKEGDTVYVLNAEDTECHLGVIPSGYACQGCEERECDSVRTYHIRELSNINKWTILDYLWQDRFGKDVFTTKDEAEKALAKMKGGAE